MPWLLSWLRALGWSAQRRIQIFLELGRLGWLSLPAPAIIRRLRALRRIAWWCTLLGVGAGGTLATLFVARRREVPDPRIASEGLLRGLLWPRETPMRTWRPRDALVGDVSVAAGQCLARLRRRARWVRRLEIMLGGGGGIVSSFLAGRWVPDLPDLERPLDQVLILTWLNGGARILGGGSEVTVVGEGGEHEREVRSTFWTCELRDGSVVVIFPELLAKLSCYAFCRKRDASLVSALRLRALEWCRAQGFSSVLSLVAVTGSLRLAFEIGPEERLTELTLRSLGEGPTRWWHSS